MVSESDGGGDSVLVRGVRMANGLNVVGILSYSHENVVILEGRYDGKVVVVSMRMDGIMRIFQTYRYVEVESLRWLCGCMICCV